MGEEAILEMSNLGAETLKETEGTGNHMIVELPQSVEPGLDHQLHESFETIGITLRAEISISVV